MQVGAPPNSLQSADSDLVTEGAGLLAFQNRRMQRARTRTGS